ncbi:MAG: GNAT family N-acetyltransferase [Ktedonobacteraceae bacterium]
MHFHFLRFYFNQKEETMQQNIAIQVIQAETQHIPLIVPLFDAYRQFYKRPANREGAFDFLTQRFQEGSSVLFLAIGEEEQEKPFAYGFVQLYPTFSSVSMKRLWILNDLFVIPEGRRQGVGTKLLERAHAFVVETHAKGLTLKTAVENVSAQALYESLGWQRDTHFFSYDIDF